MILKLWSMLIVFPVAPISGNESGDGARGRMKELP